MTPKNKKIENSIFLENFRVNDFFAETENWKTDEEASGHGTHGHHLLSDFGSFRQFFIDNSETLATLVWVND